MLQHRDSALLGHCADQPLAAARDHQIDVFILLEKHVDRGAIRHRDELDHISWYISGLEPGTEGRGDRAIGVDRFLATSENGSVAGLQAKRSSVRRDVGPALVDHGDDPQGDADAAHGEAVGSHKLVCDLAERIRLIRDLPNRVSQLRHPAVVHEQAVTHRSADPCGVSSREVERVGGHDLIGRFAQDVRHGLERHAALLAGGRRQLTAGRASSTRQIRYQQLHRSSRRDRH